MPFRGVCRDAFIVASRDLDHSEVAVCSIPLLLFFVSFAVEKQVRGLPRGVLAAVHPGRALPVDGVPDEQEQRKTFHAGIVLPVDAAVVTYR